MGISIASVTLAYKFDTQLPKQLEALRLQVRALDEMIVVNNGANDQTSAMLAARHPNVTALNLSVNQGAGGGYAAGMAYAALKKKHDWVWLLDQDSVPAADALEQLLAPLQRMENLKDKIGLIAPVLTHSGTGLSYSGMRWANKWVRMDSAATNEPVHFADAVISSGSLIRREVIEQVGLPRADFFIDFVDFEYCLRIRSQGFIIAVVSASHLEHSIGNPQRKSLLGFSYAWGGHEPWREYYKARNEIFTLNLYFPGWHGKLSVFSRVLRHALGILLFGSNKLQCFKMIVRGLRDGSRGQLGVRFLPDCGKTRLQAVDSRPATVAPVERIEVKNL